MTSSDDLEGKANYTKDWNPIKTLVKLWFIKQPQSSDTDHITSDKFKQQLKEEEQFEKELLEFSGESEKKNTSKKSCLVI